MTGSSCTREEFQAIYDKYNLMIYRLSMLHTGNEEDAKDIMQEVFMKLLYSAPVFGDDEYEKKWVIRVTINLCRDNQRSFWKKNKVSLGEHKKEFNDERQNVVDLYEVSNSEASEVADTINDRLGELIYSMPDKYKDVIHLHYYEGYGITEIAKILHIGESAVKMRLKRGRTYLKMELE